MNYAFEWVNDWKQLWGKYNWIDLTVVSIQLMWDKALPGFEVEFVFFGIGFYLRVNRDWSTTEDGVSVLKRWEEVDGLQSKEGSNKKRKSKHRAKPTKEVGEDL